MPKDLRDFFDQMKSQHPQYVIEIVREVSADLEIPIIQEKLSREKKYSIIIAKNVLNSTLPVVTNLFADYQLLAFALGIESGDKKDILKEYIKREDCPLPIEEVDKKDAPVKELILKGNDVDLGKLPISKHCEKDSGKYITTGCMICKDPDNGIPNVGIYRNEVKGKNQLGCMMNPAQHAAQIKRKYQELQKPMEIAIFIGHHPAVFIGASSKGPLEHNELEIMGALLGEPLTVTRGETVDLTVPAYAEIVIEGVIRPESFVIDGPFAEYAGYYGGRKEVALIEVTAITMRQDAIYHDLYPSYREHTLAGVLCREAQLYRRIKETVPSLVGLHLPPSGNSFYHLYISIKKRVQGEGKLAALAALGTNADIKHVVVVDDDIDIHNDEEVLWAISTRVEADLDVTIIPFVFGAHLDPSAYGETRFNGGPMTSKVIIDATKPLTLPFAERVVPNKEIWERINLKDYF